MASWTCAQICRVLFLYLVGVQTQVAAHRQLFIIIKRSSTLTHLLTSLWDNQAQIAFFVQNLKREFHDWRKQDQGNLKPTLVAYIFYGSLDLKRHTKRKRVWRGVGIICPAIVIELSTQSFQHNTFIRAVSSWRLLATLLIQFELVYRPFGRSNMQSILDFCPRPAKKETNVPLHNRS